MLGKTIFSKSRILLTGALVAVFALMSLLGAANTLAYGGGGVSYTAPTVTTPSTSTGSTSVIAINSGAKTTNSSKVTLVMPTTSGDQMAISNTSDFKNVAWETYSATKEWVLLPTAGTQTVYVMFRSSSTGATTAVYQGTIELTATGAASAQTTTGSTGTGTTGTTSGTTATTAGTTTGTGTTGTMTTYTFTKYLAVGSSGTEVTELQTLLKSLGYYTYSSITGYYGSVTEAAVKAYQKASNLAPFPGYVGPATRAALSKVKFKSTTTTTSTTSAATTQTTTQTTTKYTFKGYLSVGSSGDEVKQLQLKLKELGYFTYAGGATGYYGTVTEAAVKAFQKAKNLAPYPGYVGPGTRTELNK